jgi:hypothetical protein
MTDLLAILTDLSKVAGVPVAICLAWAAFIIRDQGRRITRLEELREKDAERLDKKLDDIYNRLTDVAVEVARKEGEQ